MTRLSPADGNVIAAFFSTLFRLSASSFHHDSNRNTSARVQVSVEALIIIFLSFIRDLHSSKKEDKKKMSSKTSQ
jgi:hypothetical protein